MCTPLIKGVWVDRGGVGGGGGHPGRSGSVAPSKSCNSSPDCPHVPLPCQPPRFHPPSESSCGSVLEFPRREAHRMFANPSPNGAKTVEKYFKNLFLQEMRAKFGRILCCQSLLSCCFLLFSTNCFATW